MSALEHPTNNTHTAGSHYEDMAAAYLTAAGMTILKRNFRCRFGEIDIIASDRGTVVFVEVKYRSGRKAGDPLEAVGIRKQQKIIATAMYYISSAGRGFYASYRFDVIGIRGDGSIEHIRNAFGIS